MSIDIRSTGVQDAGVRSTGIQDTDAYGRELRQAAQRWLAANIGDSSTASSTASQARKECFVVESLKISGDALMSKVNDLIRQGNVRRIVIKNKEGHTLLSVPTTLTAVGSTLNAILSTEATAINVISAIVPYPKLVVEKLG